MMNCRQHNQIEQGATILIGLFGDFAIFEAQREQQMAQLLGHINECRYWRAVEDETKWKLTVAALPHQQVGHA